MKKETKIPAKILIIEDEVHIRRLLTQTLELAFDKIIDNDELEIFEASDGIEGMEIAKAEKPNLIFSDIMMPKMNGYDLCEIIKKEINLKSTYVILLTAKGQEIDKKKGFFMGADEYITKPFDPEKIVSKIEDILKIKKSG